MKYEDNYYILRFGEIMRINNLFICLLCSLMFHASAFFVPFARLFREKPRQVNLGMIRIDFIRGAAKDAKPGARTTSRNILYEKPAGAPAAESRPEQKASSDLDAELPTGKYDLAGPSGRADGTQFDNLPPMTEYFEPFYPESALAQKLEGVVTLKFLIDAAGSVKQLKVLDNGGFYEFGVEAYKAVKKWKFIPTRIRNRQLDIWYVQKVKFVLEKPAP